METHFFRTPPPLTGGWKILRPYPLGEKLSEKCDWIAFTVPFYKDLTWPDLILDAWKEIRPIRNYNKGQENAQGIKLFWHDTRPAQGKHIILSGSTLTRLGENTYGVLNWIRDEEYHISRIDLCVDVTHTNLNPRNATYHLNKGQYKSHAHSAPRWDDSLQAGYTQYIGKKTSETYVRIYDKASEMGVSFKWVRCEIVLQGDRATPALHAYLRDNSVRGLLSNFIKFPNWKKWNAILQATPVTLEVIPKETATRAWLMGSVAKSIAKEMALEDSHEFWLNMVQRIREEYFTITKEDERIEF